MASFWRRLIPSKNDRELRRLTGQVEAIASHETRLRGLTDEALRAQTPRLQERFVAGWRAAAPVPAASARLASSEGDAGLPQPLVEGTDPQGSRRRQRARIDAALAPLLPEAFATMREASRRVLGMRHYDVQLIGGMALHEGRIAEMKTGEGKTLVATLPVYLNALAGLGVFLVTVNEYLAARDAAWMGQVYRFLGLDVGVILHGLTDAQRQAAYRCPVTYGTNSEFGFDFLRDNMKLYLRDYTQRGHHFAIVDEVDSILIDEARTPLIISGPSEDSTDKYARIDSIIPALKREEDFTVDEKARAVSLTEAGVHSVEGRLGVGNLYEPENLELLHHVNQGLRAHALYRRDVDYMVEEGRVKIIDEFTGRVLEGRRWSDGLHQAVEAKEGVKVENENQTLASITYQNLFRNFTKLAGMTGTAETEAEEFAKVYDLEVVMVPTHQPMRRVDAHDLIYKSEREKFSAIVDEIQERSTRGQPVLVGTISVEKSEVLSRHLQRLKIPHAVLNAKYHRQEAEIIAQAGRKSAVTIATNMAGRGTDILLGGNPEVQARLQAPKASPGPEGEAKAEAAYQSCLQQSRLTCQAEKEAVIAAGGLHILGTERHESRRIDNQLRGRAGRQGDPGSSCFYISLEDDLLRIFGGEKLIGRLEWLGMQDGDVIEGGFINRRIEETQRRVEGHNFDVRKHLLEYDDVMNDQRTAIYSLRRRVIGADMAATRVMMLDLIEDVVIQMARSACPDAEASDAWDLHALADSANECFTQSIWELGDLSRREEVEEQLFKVAQASLTQREEQFTPTAFFHVSRILYLQAIDGMWKDHLRAMEQLREGISLRGYAQRDPKQEYKKEGFSLFSAMMANLAADVLQKVYRVVITAESQTDYEARLAQAHQAQARQLQEGPAQKAASSAAARLAPAVVSPPPGASRPASPQGAAPRPEPLRRGPKVGPNDPCPCGSGNKYKKCHMLKETAGES